eukprot:jgi/Mesen1/8439/ME000475S07715
MPGPRLTTNKRRAEVAARVDHVRVSWPQLLARTGCQLALPPPKRRHLLLFLSCACRQVSRARQAAAAAPWSGRPPAESASERSHGPHPSWTLPFPLPPTHLLDQSTIRVSLAATRPPATVGPPAAFVAPLSACRNQKGLRVSIV